MSPPGRVFIRIVAAVVWATALARSLQGDIVVTLNGAEKAVADDAERLIGQLRDLPTGQGDYRWIEAMMELSALGPAAIPHVDAALQETDVDVLKRRLLIVLRTFDDVRAVPTVIRFMPRLGEPTKSDYGMLVPVGDNPSDAMVDWLIEHCRGHRAGGGVRYSFGRPVNEAFRTLERLTGKKFGSTEVRFMEYTGDATRDNAIAKLFHEKAEQWSDWWGGNAAVLTDDERYHTAELPPFAEKKGPSPLDEGVTAEVVSRRSNTIISPIDSDGEYGRCFLDLDTGRQLDGRDRWQGEPFEECVAWAKQQGFDLMAVEREDQGATRYALMPLAATFWQISRSDGKNIGNFLGKSKQLVLGETGELLLDYESVTKTYGDAAKPAFLYETEFGCVGVIFVDGDVTELFKTDENGRVVNGGPIGSTPGSRGFSYGVKISHHALGVKTAP